MQTGKKLVFSNGHEEDTVYTQIFASLFHLFCIVLPSLTKLSVGIDAYERKPLICRTLSLRQM